LDILLRSIFRDFGCINWESRYNLFILLLEYSLSIEKALLSIIVLSSRIITRLTILFDIVVNIKDSSDFKFIFSLGFGAINSLSIKISILFLLLIYWYLLLVILISFFRLFSMAVVGLL
jgi:hypothetical protein